MSTITSTNNTHRPSTSLRQAAIKKNMSITQTYYLAHKARAKLSREASQPDHDLRLLVGHANLLDSLMLELADAEREQERWFNQSVRGASNTKERHVQWADQTVTEEEYDSDSSSDSDDYDSDEDIEMSNNNVTIRPQPIKAVASPRMSDDDDMEEDDLEEDYAQLELVRTPSHSTSPPDLVEEDFSESSEDESMPPSPPQPALENFDAEAAKKESEEDDQIYEEDYYLPPRNPARLVSAISVY